MRKHEYFIRRLEKELDELPAMASREEVEQLKKDHPGMTVLVPIGGRPVVTVMYDKTDAQGAKPEKEDSK